MEKTRAQKSIINISTGLLGQLINTLLSFVNRTIFINVLGKMYLGINGYFSDILTMLSLADLGLNTAMNYKLYKPVANNDTKKLQALMKYYRKIFIIIGCVFLAIGLILIPFLPKLIKDYDSLIALNINIPLIFSMYLISNASSYFFSASKSTLINADQKMYIFSIANIITSVCTSVVQVIVLIVFKNFLLYTLISIIFGITNNLIVAKIADKKYPEVFCKNDSELLEEEKKDIYKDSAAVFIHKIDTVVIKATDSIVLSKCIGIAIVGLYSNYLMFYNAFRLFLKRIFSGVKDSLGNYFAVESEENKYNLFGACNLLTFVMYGTACIGIAVCSNEVINQWIGKSFIIPQPLPILVGFEILCVGLDLNLSQIINITGLYRKEWYRPLLSVTVNVVLSFVLVQKYSIYGVIIGTIASSIFVNLIIEPVVIYKYYFCKLKEVSNYYLSILKYFLTVLLVLFVDYFICSKVLIGYGWISIIIHALICGISLPATFLIIFYNTIPCRLVRSVINEEINRIIKKRKNIKA